MANSKYSGMVSVAASLREGGFWVLTSDDLPGLLLAGKDLDELDRDVPNVIRALYRLNYELDVEVRKMVPPTLLKKPEVAEACWRGERRYSASPRAAA